MSAPYRLEALSQAHDRKAFSCGIAALDRYLKEQVTQDIRRLLASCYVAVDQASRLVAAYYTLAATSIAAGDLPTEDTKRLARYPILPAALIGRLAVDLRFRGRGIGAALLADAAMRSLRSEAAVFTLVVKAKDTDAAAFYRAHGFRPLDRDPDTLFLPLGGREKLLRS